MQVMTYHQMFFLIKEIRPKDSIRDACTNSTRSCHEPQCRMLLWLLARGSLQPEMKRREWRREITCLLVELMRIEFRSKLLELQRQINARKVSTPDGARVKETG